MVEFKLDESKAVELEIAMKLVPQKAEKLVNESLKTKGVKHAIFSIIELIPVSKRKKAHAKDSNPLRSKMFNLGFEIIAKGGAASNVGSFGYLVFPNNGLGSSNPVAHHFFENGIEKANDNILNDVIAALNEAINMGG